MGEILIDHASSALQRARSRAARQVQGWSYRPAFDCENLRVARPHACDASECVRVCEGRS